MYDIECMKIYGDYQCQRPFCSRRMISSILGLPWSLAVGQQFKMNGMNGNLKYINAAWLWPDEIWPFSSQSTQDCSQIGRLDETLWTQVCSHPEVPGEVISSTEDTDIRVCLVVNLQVLFIQKLLQNTQSSVQYLEQFQQAHIWVQFSIWKLWGKWWLNRDNCRARRIDSNEPKIVHIGPVEPAAVVTCQTFTFWRPNILCVRSAFIHLGLWQKLYDRSWLQSLKTYYQSCSNWHFRRVDL